MTKIKIVSDPYQKQTSFQYWDEAEGQWTDINQVNNANSRLLNDSLRVGFFPFNVKQIVDIIVDEYYAGFEKIEIEFEGTSDEYDEIKSICEGSSYLEKVSLCQHTRQLANARNILPEIIKIFDELRPLASENVPEQDKLEKELKRFSEASDKDAIPICIVGNYSSGKSTLINALIGYEILPSSDEPTTAKIYKITRSQHTDQASVRLEYDQESVCLSFSNSSYKLLTAAGEHPFITELKCCLEEISQADIPTKLYKALSFINDCANESDGERISDLVEIETPFNEAGLFGRRNRNFAIFDTPGSNSASNIRHTEVLKKAMANLSNGLPIFVSEYDSLDSTDNDMLYQEINNMSELDNRFTMIIVNKADNANLGGYDRNRFMGQAIPRKLYSGGIYFVSSFIGLGGKIGGNFMNEKMVENFGDQSAKYENPGHKYYKSLYKYNIMPEQIKIKYDKFSKKEGNRLYANSGLYSVEQAIEDFSEKYSAYNKCDQSQRFLFEIIQILSDTIDKAVLRRDEYRERIRINLDTEKGALVEKIEQSSKEQTKQFESAYSAEMDGAAKDVIPTITLEELCQQEEILQDKAAEERRIDELKSDVNDSKKVVYDNLVDRLHTVKEDPLSALKMPSAVMEFFKANAEAARKIKDIEEAASKDVATELIKYVRRKFEAQAAEAQASLEERSRSYWVHRANICKQTLAEIAANSDSLSEENRSRLVEIIVKYQEIDLRARANTFSANKYRRIFAQNKLSLRKLMQAYNSQMQKLVQDVRSSLEEEHKASFTEWLSVLDDTIIEHIEEFSPQLHNQVEIIREETARINDLKSKQATLQDCRERIKNLMAWSDPL